MMRVINVPEAFVREIGARENESGRAWLNALPGLVDQTLAKWGLTPSGRRCTARSAWFVPVRQSDGTAAVVKISFPHPGNLAEPKALAAWASVARCGCWSTMLRCSRWCWSGRAESP
jgi:hypothetical protein